MSRLFEPRTPFTLVVGIEFTEASAQAFEEGARIARRIPGCAVHFVHVARRSSTAVELQDAAGQLRLYTEEKLASLGWTPDETEGQSVGIHARAGEVAVELAQAAAKLGADLIIVGKSRRAQLRHLVREHIAVRLRGFAPCPVVVAEGRPYAQTDRATVPEASIEPPCPLCVAVRFASQGSEWWCTQHGGIGTSASILPPPRRAAG